MESLQWLIKLKLFSVLRLLGLLITVGALATPVAALAETYVVQPDDMLGTVSLKLYGTARLAPRIAALNDLRGSGRIHKGMVP